MAACGITVLMGWASERCPERYRFLPDFLRMSGPCADAWERNVFSLGMALAVYGAFRIFVDDAG